MNPAHVLRSEARHVNEFTPYYELNHLIKEMVERHGSDNIIVDEIKEL